MYSLSRLRSPLRVFLMAALCGGIAADAVAQQDAATDPGDWLKTADYLNGLREIDVVPESAPGGVQVTLTWDVNSDLDLHVIEPSGERIFYRNTSSATGGALDLDSNAGCRIDGIRAENIRWPPGAAPPGEYRVQVHEWASCRTSSSNYVVRIRNGTSVQTYSGTISGGSRVEVASFTVGVSEPVPMPFPVTPESPAGVCIDRAAMSGAADARLVGRQQEGCSTFEELAAVLPEVRNCLRLGARTLGWMYVTSHTPVLTQALITAIIGGTGPVGIVALIAAGATAFILHRAITSGESFVNGCLEPVFRAAGVGTSAAGALQDGGLRQAADAYTFDVVSSDPNAIEVAEHQGSIFIIKRAERSGTTLYITANDGDGVPVSTFTYLMDPYVPTTGNPVRVPHLSDLRAEIDAVRRRCSLPGYLWTDPVIVGGQTPVRAVHVREMRAALTEAYSACRRTPPTYTDPVLAPGVTPVKVIHFSELQAAAAALF